MTTNMNIVDRVVERLKAQPIGDLITEEDLHDIVKEAIPKVFFAERLEKQQYGSDKRHPPLIYDALKEVLQAHVLAAVDDWVKANPEIMAEHWKAVFDKGIVAYVQAAQDAKMTTLIRDAMRPMIDTLNRERSSVGLPSIFI